MPILPRTSLVHSVPISSAVLCALSACGAAQREVPPSSAAVADSNLIANGDFSRGTDPWGAHTAGAAGAGRAVLPRLVDGALCTELRGGEELIVGWPVAGSAEFFALSAGERYELSLRASASGSVAPQCVIKVGHQLAPYTAAFTISLALKPTLEPFGEVFAPDHADDRAGIAVECRAAAGSPSADVCIDDVSLRSATAR